MNKTISVELARSLAIHYCAFCRTPSTEKRSKALYADLLLESQRESGIELMPEHLLEFCMDVE